MSLTPVSISEREAVFELRWEWNGWPFPYGLRLEEYIGSGVTCLNRDGHVMHFMVDTDASYVDVTYAKLFGESETARYPVVRDVNYAYCTFPFWKPVQFAFAQSGCMRLAFYPAGSRGSMVELGIKGLYGETSLISYYEVTQAD